jgi:hypothetical protein
VPSAEGAENRDRRKSNRDQAVAPATAQQQPLLVCVQQWQGYDRSVGGRCACVSLRSPHPICHCEERSDEAIQSADTLDCFATLAMTLADPLRTIFLPVTPAKAGVHGNALAAKWISACAGMTD